MVKKRGYLTREEMIDPRSEFDQDRLRLGVGVQ